MTKTQFLADYRASLLATMAWAGVEAQLDRFIQSVERTIRTEAKTWNHDSPLADKLWRAAGNKGKATLKGLRALPD
jgi:hypothetical protein